MTGEAGGPTADPGQQPLFSIIIPTHNRCADVLRAVESALRQRVSDVEVIVVDDASTDDTVPALRAIADPRLRLFVSDANGGAAAARNRGIENARGRYIAFLDSDDRFLPFHLTDLLPLLAQGEDTVAYSRVVVDRGSGRSFLKPHRGMHAGETIDGYLMRDRGFIQTSSLALGRRLADAVRYREDVGFGDDTDFAVRLSIAGGQFVMAPRASVIWSDERSESRLSQVRANIGNLLWLRDLRPHIATRSYLAYMGWHGAKNLWPTSPRIALGHYFDALLHGAFRPHIAAIVLLQIIVPDRTYRDMANRWVALTTRLGGSRP